jgi:hypothetical protein
MCVLTLQRFSVQLYLRLEGGAADEEGTSVSLVLFRFDRLAAPRLPDDMLGRSGELERLARRTLHKEENINLILESLVLQNRH